jgi:hypothetical protein
MGTLRCHYRHRSHGDPFFLPGLQDITAHVDFTAMGRAAESAGAGYPPRADDQIRASRAVHGRTESGWSSAAVPGLCASDRSGRSMVPMVSLAGQSQHRRLTGSQRRVVYHHASFMFFRA